MKNTIKNITNVEDYAIEETKSWSSDLVRELCIENQWYTRGTNEEYEVMLDFIENNAPVVGALFVTAKDIYDHSDFDSRYDAEDEVIENIMFLLNRKAVITSYWIH